MSQEAEKARPEILKVIPGFKGIIVKDLDELKRLHNPADIIVEVLAAFFSVFNKNKMRWDQILIEMKSS